MFERGTTEERRCSCYIHKPETLHTVSSLTFQDQNLARYIAEMEQEIQRMKEFRQENFARLHALYAANYRPKVKLERQRRNSDGKVYFYLTTWNVYDDPSIAPEQISSKTYPGSQRRQAISDFRAYVKSHPGILSEMDVEKKSWER